MKAWWMRWLVLLALVVAPGCGSDGGVGGTGISTITGNVALGGAASLRAVSNLEGIGVDIRGTGLHTMTDRVGHFSVEGNFDGDVTVDFTERDGTVNMLLVDVPSGGVLSLRNVRFSRGLATPERIDVTFEAFVSRDPVCGDGSGTVEVEDRDSRNTFVLLVDADTTFESDDGCPDMPQCTDLVRQVTVKVVGTQDDQGIHADRIRLVNCRPPGRNR